MKTYKNLYSNIYTDDNLFLAWRKARKGKTKKRDIKEFEKNLINNLEKLKEELKNETYTPKSLVNFILRDPKTRKISKSDFRDRIIHHAIVNLIESIFERIFIYDSCASRIGKGSLFALKIFDYFKRKVSRNGKVLRNNFKDSNFIEGYCFKADIRDYFQEVNHNILINVLKKKINDDKLIRLIIKVLNNGQYTNGVGMPLGNLTSQFFANVYLNELDYFVKHTLKSRYYIKYVDDFVILHDSKEQLRLWKAEIEEFLRKKLKLQLHPQKSSIIPLSRGIDFVGFRNFYHYRLLRKRNIRKMIAKIGNYGQGLTSEDRIIECFQGFNAYAKWANSYKLRRKVLSKINKVKMEKSLISSLDTIDKN